MHKQLHIIHSIEIRVRLTNKNSQISGSKLLVFQKKIWHQKILQVQIVKAAIETTKRKIGNRNIR